MIFICWETLQAGQRQLTASKCPCKCAKIKEYQRNKKYILSSYCSLHSGTKNADVHYHGNATVHRAAQVNSLLKRGCFWCHMQNMCLLDKQLSLLTFSVKMMYLLSFCIMLQKKGQDFCRIVDNCMVLRESQDIFQKVFLGQVIVIYQSQCRQMLHKAQGHER